VLKPVQTSSNWFEPIFLGLFCGSNWFEPIFFEKVCLFCVSNQKKQKKTAPTQRTPGTKKKYKFVIPCFVAVALKNRELAEGKGCYKQLLREKVASNKEAVSGQLGVKLQLGSGGKLDELFVRFDFKSELGNSRKVGQKSSTVEIAGGREEVKVTHHRHSEEKRRKGGPLSDCLTPEESNLVDENVESLLILPVGRQLE